MYQIIDIIIEDVVKDDILVFNITVETIMSENIMLKIELVIMVVDVYGSTIVIKVIKV